MSALAQTLQRRCQREIKIAQQLGSETEEFSRGMWMGRLFAIHGVISDLYMYGFGDLLGDELRKIAQMSSPEFLENFDPRATDEG